jgi:hypothetical protein
VQVVRVQVVRVQVVSVQVVSVQVVSVQVVSVQVVRVQVVSVRVVRVQVVRVQVVGVQVVSVQVVSVQVVGALDHSVLHSPWPRRGAPRRAALLPPDVAATLAAWLRGSMRLHAAPRPRARPKRYTHASRAIATRRSKGKCPAAPS